MGVPGPPVGATPTWRSTRAEPGLTARMYATKASALVDQRKGVNRPAPVPPSLGAGGSWPSLMVKGRVVLEAHGVPGMARRVLDAVNEPSMALLGMATPLVITKSAKPPCASNAGWVSTRLAEPRGWWAARA